MTNLYFFLYLWVIFALPDPDPATQINADPADPNPDPQTCTGIWIFQLVVEKEKNTYL
jgi:hypothetical protein